MEGTTNDAVNAATRASKRANNEPCCSRTVVEEDRIAEKRARKAATQREKWANLPEEEKEKRREKEAARARARRARQSDEQKEKDASSRRELTARRREEALNLEAIEIERNKESTRELHATRERERYARRAVETGEILKKLAEAANENEDAVIEHCCGNLNVKCFECGAMHFESEPFNAKTVCDETGDLIRCKTFTKCCKNGQIKLENPPEYPEPFLSMMKKEVDVGKNFMENIRSINSSFAFASMGANIVPPKGYGPYTFRIQGQIYHRTGTLHPKDGENRQFAQLYIIDTSQANHERAQHSANSNVDPSIFNDISFFMENYNPFCKAYKMLHQVERESVREAMEKGMTKVKEVSMAIVHDRTKDKRRYNIATANEVAVVFSNTDGLPPLDRDLIIHLKCDIDDPNRGMKRINILDRNIEPLTYPLLFPFGEQGWGIDLLRNKSGTRTRISQMEYYSYRLAIRESFNPLLNAGKLTQQYVVDAYVKMEGNRLNYIQHHQKEWRGDTLKGLQDYVANQAEMQGKEVGTVVVLPSSFPGGPRYMQQNYQDAMSIVTKFGKPDLFVTMTCNPKWKEIVDNLELWQTSDNRPDLIARVFNLKLNNLLADITNPKGGIFGIVIGHVYVIEFQKRGLPHAHILLILDKASKLDTEEKIDRVVKAEIPDKEKYPRLFEIVTRHMVHGPCGKGTTSVCMEGNVCQKKFPRAFQERTLGNECIKDGYALYKRSRLPPVSTDSGKIIDNRWIVPYNPYLLLKYNCHINVEVCASVQSVKYLFKYVYKGHDCANVELKDSNVINQNEVKKHVDSRYVSAPEAAWRLSGNDMHGQSHSVERLAVHLPGEQYIVLNTSIDAEATVNDETGDDGIVRQIKAAGRKHTTLTGWFELNRIDETARQYCYWEIPLHYTWLKTDRKWKVRERFFNKIGRMYTVNPKDAERFYLRLLLLHVRGATSFDHLRTVDGVLYETFRESAIARGYLLDDEIWQKTLDDAIALQMPAQLRQIFAYICAYCSPSDPKKLWDDNVKDFTEDICNRRHQNIGDCRRCEEIARQDLKTTCSLLGVSLRSIGLDEPNLDLLDTGDEYSTDDEEEEAGRMIQTLNADQKNAFDAIVASINDDDTHAKFFFVDGPGGSGKTYLYTTLLHHVRSKNLIALPAASTGIAANLLIGGRTFHSMFRLGIPIHEGTRSTINFHSREANVIRNAALIIVDECTMASCHAVVAIDQCLRFLTGKDVPFGGITVLFGGDFRQCLTIIPHAQRAAIVQGSIKKYSEWSSVKKFTLSQNMRSVDEEYSTWLLKLGDGTLECELGLDFVEVPDRVICRGSIVHEIFGTSITVSNVKSMSKRAILCPKNDSVDKMNDQIMDLIEGDECIYLSSDSLVDDIDAPDFTTEFLNTVKISGLPPYKLKLKVGAVIMLMRNLNTKRGLCNGTRLVVTALHRNLIEAEVLCGSAEGDRVLIPRIDICPSNSDLPFKMKRRQFPVKLAFAMTINKSQGQTLDKVGIFLPEPVFGHGQLYVAFSRVRRFEDVKVKVEDTEEQGILINGSDKVFTRNIVYHEVLNDDKSFDEVVSEEYQSDNWDWAWMEEEWPEMSEMNGDVGENDV